MPVYRSSYETWLMLPVTTYTYASTIQIKFNAKVSRNAVKTRTLVAVPDVFRVTHTHVYKLCVMLPNQRGINRKIL